jgi:hypothetical protein
MAILVYQRVSPVLWKLQDEDLEKIAELAVSHQVS